MAKFHIFRSFIFPPTPVFPTIFPPERENKSQTGRKKHAHLFFAAWREKTGCTLGIFFANFRLLARFHGRLLENSCFPFGAISNMCASGNVVGFSPCSFGTRSRASPSPRAKKTGKIKPPILP